MTPLILLPADVRPDGQYGWHAVLETYLNAVTRIGATPLILPALGSALDLDAVLAGVDGVLLPGSRSNVHPSLYGETAEARHEPFDEARDATSLPLIRAAIEAGVPLFAICRGMQELNVALGGSLHAEVHRVPGRMNHRAADSELLDVRYSLAHDVAFEPDSGLGRAIGETTARVNSVHRQGIARLADPLAVEAKAPDGTIEAVRVRDAPAFAYGVQWHPEYWSATDAPSAALFRAFGEAARRRHAARRGVDLRQAAE